MVKIKKIFSVIVRGVIKKVDVFSARKYMNLYCKYLKSIGVDLTGTPRYIHPSVIFDGVDFSKTHIGENVVISRGVLLLVHDYSITCALKSIEEKIDKEAFWVKDIYIGDNVFIGANTTILPGTYIEKNCIIGAGSVIKGRISQDSIVAGNPAKKIANIKEWAINKKQKGDYFFEQ